MNLAIKPQFLATLARVQRPGMDSLISFLKSSDFFTAPASTRFHAAYEGGLAEHSWSVYRVFSEKVKTYRLEMPEESVIICGLLHDICKTDVYRREMKRVKEHGAWTEKEGWGYADEFPYGHGEKSVYLLERHIRLTDMEALTIRWHMGLSEPREMWRQFDTAKTKYPSVVALFVADMESASLAENVTGKGGATSG